MAKIVANIEYKLARRQIEAFSMFNKEYTVFRADIQRFELHVLSKDLKNKFYSSGSRLRKSFVLELVESMTMGSGFLRE